MDGALLRLAACAETLGQGLAQQRVQAVPGFALGAGRGGDEEVLLLQPREQGQHLMLAQRLFAQRLAQRCGKAFARGRAHQQLGFVGRQPRQDFALEIFGEGAGVLHVGLHEAAGKGDAAGVGLLAFPVRGEQLQAGDPAVGLLVQQARIARADLAQLGTQEVLRFRQRETQVALVQFQQQALVAQASQRQRQRRARGEHHVEVGRGVVEQPLQRLQHARGGQLLHVVEHQRHFARMRADAAHQRHDGALHGFVVGAAVGQQRGLAGDVGADLRQAAEHAVEPALALVVGGFQRQRGHVEAQRQQVQAPGAQQRGLAVAGRPLQHDAAPPARLGQLRQQPFARDHARGAAQRCRARRRRGQRGGLAAGWRRRVGWRVGHRDGGKCKPVQ
ncbi:hypothetical protein D9M68_484390 [compost metagenome]